MPQFEVPFKEPEREESKGEAQQRLASLVQMALMLLKTPITENEREHIAGVIGIAMRRFPILKQWGADEKLSAIMTAVIKELMK
jgi:hypothetical protein